MKSWLNSNRPQLDSTQVDLAENWSSILTLTYKNAFLKFPSVNFFPLLIGICWIRELCAVTRRYLFSGELRKKGMALQSPGNFRSLLAFERKKGLVLTAHYIYWWTGKHHCCESN